jgi:hypothetical protein
MKIAKYGPSASSYEILKHTRHAICRALHEGSIGHRIGLKVVLTGQSMRITAANNESQRWTDLFGVFCFACLFLASDLKACVWHGVRDIPDKDLSVILTTMSGSRLLQPA